MEELSDVLNPIRKTVILSFCIAFVMFGFSFALSPLYSAFCKATGFNSAVKINFHKPDLSRSIVVQFVTTNNHNLPWEFYSRTTHINVHPEQNIKVIFFAKNTTKKTMTVQAIPSFAPPLAAQYFHKIQCFCFNQQTLKAGESAEMPVIFRVDNKLPLDVHTITLGYTLFDVTSDRSGKEA